MPFPLAHPAAVLPLRRFCPRYLSFPALVIGSLSPDAGYFSGHFRLGEFSHRLFPGSFAFCLPAGLLMLLVFYLVRSPAVGVLPARYRQVFLPLCRRPVGSPIVIVVSLFIGAWTHLILDSITHADGWLVEHLPVLHSSVPWVGNHRLGVYEVLYAASTFSGVAWLAVDYLRWLERAAGSPVSITRGMKWGGAILLASSILVVALASRGPYQSIPIVSAGILAVLLVMGFLLATGRRLRSPQ